MQTATLGLGILNQALGSGNGVIVDAVNEGLDLLLHDAQEDIDASLVVGSGGHAVIGVDELTHLLTNLLFVGDIKDAHDVRELSLDL